MSQQSSSFDKLNPLIQRWIWSQNWTELRDAQELAIPPIMSAQQDVIIAAATAAGKTEAAFLPILSKMLQMEEGSNLTICISPLKALINDQYGRLELLCEQINIPLWPWHGDISASSKSRFIKNPEGILLITPESLEAILCNKGFSAPQIFANLIYFVVDELHAFIGSERGKQLQSLMHRIEHVIKRKVPRIGLSATLGDMKLASDYLRPGAPDSVHMIESKASGAELKILVKGYIEKIHKFDAASETEIEPITSSATIAQHLFKILRGTNNLIFPNSRSSVEQYAYHLRQLCEQAHINNEFWPHHGSLSRELREETEAALKNKEKPATAVCTNTLELGIDIGSVKSIVQIGSPSSVASLRQRLGRSGRRKGEPAILRGYVIEQELTERSHLMTELREGLFELVAMISLLLEGWFEPPRTQGLHVSTFIQQLLSLIAQKGGISVADAFHILCTTGPFSAIGKSEYLSLLRQLGQQELITQDSSGVLLHGAKGEVLVNHYTFYAAFSTEDEYRVITNNRTLGSLPISSLVSKGDFILFAAKTWRVDDIDDNSKSIYVTKHRTGKSPPYTSMAGHTHDKVRLRMRELYASSEPITFLDQNAAQLFAQGRFAYQRLNLASQILLGSGNSSFLFTWMGDAVNQTLVAMLKQNGIKSVSIGPVIEVNANAQQVYDSLCRIKKAGQPDIEELLNDVSNLMREKWDWCVSDSLLKASYASLHLDIQAAYKWVEEQLKIIEKSL